MVLGKEIVPKSKPNAPTPRVVAELPLTFGSAPL